VVRKPGPVEMRIKIYRPLVVHTGYASEPPTVTDKVSRPVELRAQGTRGSIPRMSLNQIARTSIKIKWSWPSGTQAEPRPISYEVFGTSRHSRPNVCRIRDTARELLDIHAAFRATPRSAAYERYLCRHHPSVRVLQVPLRPQTLHVARHLNRPECAHRPTEWLYRSPHRVSGLTEISGLIMVLIMQRKDYSLQQVTRSH
jgi:hypothetical protein